MSQTLVIPSRVDPISRDTFFEWRNREYRLHYGFEAYSEYYGVFQLNPLLEDIGKDPARWAAFLFVGLLKFQPQITTDEVKGWWDSSPIIRAFYELILKAVEAQTPKVEEGSSASDPLSA